MRVILEVAANDELEAPPVRCRRMLSIMENLRKKFKWLYHLLSPRKVQKRLRLAVHCLGSAPTGLTSGVGRDRKSAAVGLDGAIYGEEKWDEMVPPPWLVDGFIPSAFREGGVEDGESVGGYWRGRKDFNRSPSRWTRKKGFVSSGIPGK